MKIWKTLEILGKKFGNLMRKLWNLEKVLKFGINWKFEKKFENLEILKKNWEFVGKNLEIWNKSEILEENFEIWGKFGNRKSFWKFGESLEMRGKIGKHFWKFVKQFETRKNFRNLKKKLKFEKHLEVWEKFGNRKNFGNSGKVWKWGGKLENIWE